MVGPSPVEAELVRLRGLIGEQRCVETSAKAAALRARGAERRQIVSARVQAQSRLADIPAALGMCAWRDLLHPHSGRSQQSWGFCHNALRQAAETLSAVERAATISPVLATSCSMLKRVNRTIGQGAETAPATERVARVGPCPAQRAMTQTPVVDGERGSGEARECAFLLEHRDHVAATCPFAPIGREGDAFDDEPLLLEGVLDLSPQRQAARFDSAQVLLQRPRYLEAEQYADKRLAVAAELRGYRTLYAMTQGELGADGRAIEFYRSLLGDTVQPLQHRSITHLLKTQGSIDTALTECRTVAACRAADADVYWSLGNLKTYRFIVEEVEQVMAGAVAAPTSREDRRDSERSFARDRDGNAFKRATRRHRAEHIERRARLQIGTCTRALGERHRASGADAVAPVFLVGLHRAGSTLIERILASQRRLGERYLSDSHAHRLLRRPRCIDEVSNSFRHIDRALRMLLNAGIIDGRRQSAVGCFGRFMQRLAQGQLSPYDVTDFPRDCRSDLERMEQRHTVFPGWLPSAYGQDAAAHREGVVRRGSDRFRFAFRTRVSGSPRNPLQCQDGEFRAAAPADLPRGAVTVATRALAQTKTRSPRRMLCGATASRA